MFETSKYVPRAKSKEKSLELQSEDLKFLIKTKKHKELQPKLSNPWSAENQKRNIDFNEDSDEQKHFDQVLRNLCETKARKKAVSKLTGTSRDNRNMLRNLLQPFIEAENIVPPNLDEPLVKNGVL